jgi:hypothetical protein
VYCENKTTVTPQAVWLQCNSDFRQAEKLNTISTRTALNSGTNSRRSKISYPKSILTTHRKIIQSFIVGLDWGQKKIPNKSGFH